MAGPYPVVSVADINAGKFNLYPRARCAGLTITQHVYAADGDVHINAKDASGNVLVAEMVPEHSLTIPRVGAKVDLWGIIRYDGDHKYWEMHPVLGIAEVS